MVCLGSRDSDIPLDVTKASGPEVVRRLGALSCAVRLS